MCGVFMADAMITDVKADFVLRKVALPIVGTWSSVSILLMLVVGYLQLGDPINDYTFVTTFPSKNYPGQPIVLYASDFANNLLSAIFVLQTKNALTFCLAAYNYTKSTFDSEDVFVTPSLTFHTVMYLKDSSRPPPGW